MIADWLQRLVYEAPATVALGPTGSALAAGYAVVIGGRIVITPAGERYLANVDSGIEPRYQLQSSRKSESCRDSQLSND